MDNATKRFLIEAHLEKAHDDLITANDMLAEDHFRGAINRAYYTVFHAASAALLWLDIELAKHSGVQSAFGEFLIKSGIIEPEFGKIFIEIYKAREEQDYDLLAVPVGPVDAGQIVQNADRFIKRVESYLRDMGAIE